MIPEQILLQPKYKDLTKLVLICEAMEDYAKFTQQEMLVVFEDIDDCLSQSSPDLIYIKARIKDVLKEYYKLHT